MLIHELEHEFQVDPANTVQDMLLELRASGSTADSHRIGFVHAGGAGILTRRNPRTRLPVGTLQGFLDAYLEAHPGISVDYIHGESSLISIGSQAKTMGFIVPAMPKEDLFPTVLQDGVLPRKTFSMGEADEKRFYLEARRIVL